VLKHNVSVWKIKDALIEFHEKRGYKIFGSFPLVTDDPTVLFTNATITPFKHWFADPSAKPQNYALIQRCVRMGGASELDVVAINPYYFSSFEMFGSGMFSVDVEEAVTYLFELLNVLEIEKERLYFTVPTTGQFRVALINNGVRETRIFPITQNDIFWQEWRFGEPGPVGHGLSVIFSRSAERAHSVNQIAVRSEEFVELLNLIQVHSQTLPDGRMAIAAHPGFDLGIGIERLATVLQGCNSYQIDTIQPLVQTVLKFLLKKVGRTDEVTARICTDHLRTICLLLNEGLKPSNKRHGYVLRKLIRRLLERIWVFADDIVETKPLIGDFIIALGQYERFKVSSSLVTENIENEEQALRIVLRRAKTVLRKQPSVSRHILRDTYGLTLPLLNLTTRNRKDDINES